MGDSSGESNGLLFYTNTFTNCMSYQSFYLSVSILCCIIFQTEWMYLLLFIYIVYIYILTDLHDSCLADQHFIVTVTVFLHVLQAPFSINTLLYSTTTTTTTTLLLVSTFELYLYFILERKKYIAILEKKKKKNLCNSEKSWNKPQKEPQKRDPSTDRHAVDVVTCTEQNNKITVYKFHWQNIWYMEIKHT